jgi:adenylylsulfate kinase
VNSDAAPPQAAWLFGLPGAGKSTLARGLAQYWRSCGRPVKLLDGDDLRRGMCRDLGFTEADRKENIRRVSEAARLFLEQGVWVVAAFITPSAELRALARDIIGTERCHLVFVHCPLAVCEGRDPKGHYGEARRGTRPLFTGVGASFEAPPEGDCIRVDTSIASVKDCVKYIAHTVPPRAG